MSLVARGANPLSAHCRGPSSGPGWVVQRDPSKWAVSVPPLADEPYCSAAQISVAETTARERPDTASEGAGGPATSFQIALQSDGVGQTPGANVPLQYWRAAEIGRAHV